LPRGWTPRNHDGEVADFALMPVADAAALAARPMAAAGDTMTVDAALVTLDFLVRHALLTPAADDADPGPDLHAALDALRVVRPCRSGR
jgi:hypothetical protein